MIDLHLHFDGSLPIEVFKVLSKECGVELGKDFPENVYAPADCKSLEDYLTRFDLPLKLLQSKKTIKYALKGLINHLCDLGYIYAEIRFAPLLHLQEGLTQYEVVETALEALDEAIKEHPDFEGGLILCTMRHADEKTNLETIEVANKFKGTRVVAVDLAGAERLHPCTYYKNIFDLARKYKLNITIHAGEATGSDEIMMALDNGAMRIGHGVHLSLDKETINRVKKANVCFEFCPTSNLQTKSLLKYENVPLRQFMKNGIPVTINSDNMTVSNITAIDDMGNMKKTFNLTKEEVYSLLLTSINYSFTSDINKQKLKEKLAHKIDEYYKNL